MPLSAAAMEHRREHDREYGRANREKRAAYLRAWRQTPLGRLRNRLHQAEWRYARRPLRQTLETIGQLRAAIERRTGGA
jgi:hypothetical protein